MLVLLHNWVQGFQRSIIFFSCKKKKITHYSHNVSLRLLIKQNACVLFCELHTVHCKGTCLCGGESATYSSKLLLRRMCLLVSLGQVGAGPSLSSEYLNTTAPQHWALGRSPSSGLAPCETPRTSESSFPTRALSSLEAKAIVFPSVWRLSSCSHVLVCFTMEVALVTQ